VVNILVHLELPDWTGALFLKYGLSQCESFMHISFNYSVSILNIWILVMSFFSDLFNAGIDALEEIGDSIVKAAEDIFEPDENEDDSGNNDNNTESIDNDLDIIN
jgi:hypothetical protein